MSQREYQRHPQIMTTKLHPYLATVLTENVSCSPTKAQVFFTIWYASQTAAAAFNHHIIALTLCEEKVKMD